MKSKIRKLLLATTVLCAALAVDAAGLKITKIGESVIDQVAMICLPSGALCL